MTTYMNPETRRQLNNLCAVLKSRYPNLYVEAGGKYIRKILVKILEPDNDTHTAGNIFYGESNANNVSNQNYVLDKFIPGRVLENKHVQQKVA